MTFTGIHTIAAPIWKKGFRKIYIIVIFQIGSPQGISERLAAATSGQADIDMEDLDSLSMVILIIFIPRLLIMDVLLKVYLEHNGSLFKGCSLDDDNIQ